MAVAPGVIGGKTTCLPDLVQRGHLRDVIADQPCRAQFVRDPERQKGFRRLLSKGILKRLSKVAALAVFNLLGTRAP